MNSRTKLIHSERKVPEGFRSLATPVLRSSTTLFRQASAIVDTWNHDDVPYSYGSYGTPTTTCCQTSKRSFDAGVSLRVY
jgi:cystathionine beta-lyase/cystathionine gamma-synthase